MTVVGRPFVSFFQVVPPSVDRKRPPSRLPECVPHGWRRQAHIAATIVSGVELANVRSMAPVFSLTASTCSQVAPPSFER